MLGAITRTRAAVVCTLLALAPALGAQRAPDSGDAAQWRAAFEQDLTYFALLGPRSEGSAAELTAADRVHRRLAEVGLRPRLRSLAEAGYSPSLSSLVEVIVPGTRPDSLLVAVPLLPSPTHSHLTAVEPGADGVALALALSFARSLATAPEPPPITVHFLFLGGEHGDPDLGYPLGSRLFLQEFQSSAPTAALYLDLAGVPSRLAAYAGGAGIESPPWLIETVAAALHGAGQPLQLPRAHATHLVRLGLARDSLLAPFHLAGHPALRLAGQYDPLSAADRDRWLDRMPDFFALLLAAFADGIPDTWDRHYLLFDGPRSPLIIPEPEYVMAMIVALALVVSYGFAMSYRLRTYLAPLWQDLWRVPLMTALTYGALSAGTAAISLLPKLRSMPILWHQAPILFLALKLTVALLLVTVVRYLTGRSWFPRPRREPNARFYGAAATVILLPIIGAVAVVNVALAYSLLWALLCALLASVSQNRWATLIWVGLAPVWMIRAVIGLFVLPSLPFVELVLFAPPDVDLIATAIALPFVLLVRGGVISFVGSRRLRPVHRRRIWLHVTTAALVIVVAAGSALVMRINPYAEGRLQPLTARTIIDLDAGHSTLHLSSPAPIGTVEVNIAGEATSVTTDELEFTVPLTAVAGLMSFEERSQTSRDRRTISLSLAPAGQPRDMLLTLDSHDAFVLLDANYRFQQLGKGSYRLLVGAVPSIPLAVELTLPRDLKLVLSYVLEYDQPPIPVTIEGLNLAVATTVQVAGSIPISR